MKGKAIYTLLALVLIIGATMGCQANSVSTSSSQASSSDETSSSTSSSLVPDAKTDDGMNILGGALPAEDFKTLADAEETFGEYLGLHNTVETRAGNTFELVRLVIVNKETMLGTYNEYTVINGEHTTIGGFVIKFSMKQTVDELRQVYFEDTAFSNPTINLETAHSKIGYDITDDIYYIATLQHDTGKNYTIYSSGGMTQENMEDIVSELEVNLNSIADYT